MGTYAKKTCHECGIRRTINLMVAKKVRVKSGNIGWGLSLNPSRKKSARIQLPRNRYSNLTKYFCKNSAACGRLDYYGLKKKSHQNTTNAQTTYYSNSNQTNKSKGIIFWIFAIIFWYIYLPYIILKFIFKIIRSQKQNKNQNKNKKLETEKNSQTEKKSNISIRQKYLDLYYSEDFFDRCSIILGYKVALSDGHVAKQEFTKCAEHFMQNSKLSNNEISELWNDANQFNQQTILKLFKKKYNKNPTAISDLIENLFYIAEADGEILESEYSFIEKIGNDLGISKSIFEKIYSRKNPENKDIDTAFLEEEDFDEINDLIIEDT